MTDDPGAVHGLGAATRTAESAARTAGLGLTFPALPDFTLLILGPVDAGKTALVRALCTDRADLGVLNERPGRATTVPVDLLPGPDTRVLLGIGGTTLAPKRWLTSDRTDVAVLRTAGLRRVRVLTPDRTLLDWNLRIVDTPGIDTPGDLAGELLDEARRPGTGVLYVVPSRGPAEIDLQAFESLRGVPFVLVQNLRDGELNASQDSLDELPAPGALTRFAVPLALHRLALPGPERELLRRCAALLRTRCLPGEVPNRIRQTCTEEQAAVRTAYENRLTQIVLRRHATDPLERLRTVAELWRIERDGPAVTALDDALSTVTSLIRTAPSMQRLRQIVEDDARALLDRYNVEAARNTEATRSSRCSGAAPEQLAADFAGPWAAVRNDLLAVIDNITADTSLGLTTADQRSLSMTRAHVLEDRIEVALLGKFSSGKSSLINALLGIPPTQQFLPAKPRPTTATINRVVHRETPSIEAIWHSKMELRFLRPGAMPDQMRVSVDEIRAFGAWLRDGSVHLKDCTLESVADDTTPAKQLRAFWDLWELLEISGDNPHTHVYSPHSRVKPRLTTNTAVPVRVTVHRFARHPENWPGDLDRKAAFQAVSESPALALRIRELLVGSDHPLLKHVTIIDTPGTDAAIPHHLTMAHEAISDRPQCVVIYCFNGAIPSGTADRRNLDFLKKIKIGATEISRFFFVITQQSMVQEHQRDMVRDYVRNTLHTVGVQPSRLYFTEVIAELNDDFRDLSADINHFVGSSKGPLARSWIAHTREIVSAVRDRHQHRLDDIAQGERSRLARLASLKAEAQTLREIRAEFEISPVWGGPWLRGRVGTMIEPDIEYVDGLVEGLTSRPAFEGIGEHMSASIKDLNESAGRAVRGGGKAVAEKLRIQVATRLPQRAISPPDLPYDEEFFPVAGVIQAVKGISWRTVWKRITGLFRSQTEGWHEDVETNRDRIGYAWHASRTRGRFTTSEMVELRLAELDAELTRLADSLREEITVASRPPSKQDEATARAGLHRATTWLSWLDSLGRTVERINS